jgi:large subunit ribosomal protein L19
MNLTRINKKKMNQKNIINIIEKDFLNLNYNADLIKVGNVIRLAYKIKEGEKERTQTYEGLIISNQNKNLGKSFTLRRNVQGVGVEQIFLAHSPKILSVIKKQSSKIRRAKLYFIRKLKGKAARLKTKTEGK